MVLVLLVALASRLKTCIRDEDTVARLGGDEFAILLEQAPSHEVAVRVAGRILEAMRPPSPLQGRHVQVGASVGVTVSDATEVDAVLGEADVAMYLAKPAARAASSWPRPGARLTRSVPSHIRDRNPATGSLMPPRITLVLID